MASAQGTATINFGAAPGSQVASVVVTGQASISATSSVEGFMQGTDSTADHTAFEHKMAPLAITLVPDAIVAGTGFTLNAFSQWKLTGTFVVRWVWSD